MAFNFCQAKHLAQPGKESGNKRETTSCSFTPICPAILQRSIVTSLYYFPYDMNIIDIPLLYMELIVFWVKQKGSWF